MSAHGVEREHTMPTYAEAVRLVADDVRRNDWAESLSDAEAIEHARNVLRLPEEPATPGGYPIEEDGSTLAHAYRIVLSHDPRAAVRPVVGDEVRDADGEHVADVVGVDYGARVAVLSDGVANEYSAPFSALRRVDADIDPDAVMGWIIKPWQTN